MLQAEKLQAIKDRWEKATPGPWRWEINVSHKHVYLEGGVPTFDKTVMAFTRWGMQGAAPQFIKGGCIERCDSFAEVIPGREHHKHWCQTLNHPDAAAIASAPTDIAALLAEIERLQAENKKLRTCRTCKFVQADRCDLHNELIDNPLRDKCDKWQGVE